MIRYKILTAGNVLLKVYDMPGREIQTLVNQDQQPGTYAVSFNSGHLSSTAGIYYYRLTFGNDSKTMKMICIK